MCKIEERAEKIGFNPKTIGQSKEKAIWEKRETPFYYSREARSRRYAELNRGPGNQQDAGTVGNTMGNRDLLSGSGKTEPR